MDIRASLSSILLFCSIWVSGQTYNSLHFEPLNNNDGLLSDEVNSSSQDANGYLWFATVEGIARYDGYEFRSYKNHPYLGKLYGTDVRKISWSSDGNMLLCTANGFYAFSDMLEPIYSFATQATREIIVTDVCSAQNGNIYISSEKGLFVIFPDQQTLYKVPGINYAQQIAEDPEGHIWVGTWGKGVVKLSDDARSFTSYPLFFSKKKDADDNIVKSLLIDTNGFLWVGAWESGLYVLDISGNDQVKIIKSFSYEANNHNSIPSNIVFDIEEDKHNGIWIGTPYGAAVIQYPMAKNSTITRCEYTGNPGELSSNIVRNIFCDSSHLLWFSTKGGGVNKLHLDRNKFHHFKIPKLHLQNRTQSVQAFEKDQKGRLLLGVLSMGFVVYDIEKDTFFHFSELPEYKEIASEIELNTVKSFLWDKDSLLWMGTRYNGIVTFDARSGDIQVIKPGKSKNRLKSRSVNVMFLDNAGTVWAGTDSGLYHIIAIEGNEKKISNCTFFDTDDKAINSVRVTGILNDNSGKILVTTLAHGMFAVDQQNGKFVAREWEQVNVPYKIVSVYKDSGNRIWLGTKGHGMKLIENNATQISSPLPEGNGYGDTVFGIRQDEYGNIWLTTNRGLLKLWFQEQTPRIERFFYRDGLQGNIFIPRAFFKDKKGHFYVGGYHGFNIFNPLNITGNYSTAPVVITDILVGGKQVSYISGKTKSITLDHKSNDFSIAFSALDYLHPEANQYAYMVKGIDTDWKYVGAEMRSANYSNLLPGNYTLAIKGTNSQGVWNTENLQLSIHVKQAPYKTWWAMILYGALLTSILWAILVLRLKNERIKQRLQLEQIEHSKSEKLNQFKLRFFTNISHELLTPLSILSAAIEHGFKDQQFSMETQQLMQRNVDGLIGLIRQILTFYKQESGNMALKPVQGNISNFVANCVNDFTLLAEKQSIAFKVAIESDIAGFFDKEKLEIILRNLLSNAFKYTGDGGEIFFGLVQNNDLKTIRITVKDSGIGIDEKALPHVFDRFYRDESTDKNGQPGMGIGLNLAKNLLTQMNGTIDVSSQLGKGSEFIVNVPISESAFSDAAATYSDKERPGQYTGSQNDTITASDDDTEIILNSVYTVLIAEDNDDFRFTLAESLKTSYNILEAKDGQEALNIVLSNNIDLIVSDVIMPNMSGEELCRAIKKDTNLSHIPVILLTAKVGDRNKLLGYEAGADSYLEKPIGLKVLKVRINGLLALREKLRNNSSADVDLAPERVATPSMDEQFILKAKLFVEKNISDPQLSVKNLANELGVSNSMLYRKLRNLAGLAPNEFIRNIRLKRAAQMLQNKSFTISEVAFSCGFNDLGYFGVCFKKMFGKTPSTYQAKHKNH